MNCDEPRLTSVLNCAEAEISLSHAILLYGDQSGTSYASLHQVGKVGENGAPCIKAGKPISMASMNAVLRTIGQKTKPEILPEHILAKDDGMIMWWLPPSQRTLFFKNTEMGGDRSITMTQPGLVFCAMPGDWFIFAVKGKKRPNPEDPVFQAPYFNVWSEGRICTGNVDLPKSVQNLKMWEQAFFDSYFTHPNIHLPNQLVKFKNGPVSFWKKMLDDNQAVFPVSQLVPTGMTLAQVLDNLLVRGGV